MSHSIFRILEPDRRESVLAAINDFIEAEYTEANIRSRRALVLEYDFEMEAFAFRFIAPSPESAHLPGFRLDELPDEIAALTRKTVESLSLERGRVPERRSLRSPCPVVARALRRRIIRADPGSHPRTDRAQRHPSA